MTLGRLLLCDLELFEEGLLADVFGIGIFHPVDRVQITEVGLAFVVVVTRVRRFFGVRRRGGVDVDVGGQDVFEHRTGFAGFDVDDHLANERVHCAADESLVSTRTDLFVFVGRVHLSDGLVQIFGVELKGEETCLCVNDESYVRRRWGRQRDLEETDENERKCVTKTNR